MSVEYWNNGIKIGADYAEGAWPSCPAKRLVESLFLFLKINEKMLDLLHVT